MRGVRSAVLLVGPLSLAPVAQGQVWGPGTLNLRLVEASPQAGTPLSAFPTSTSAVIDATGATEVSVTLWVQAWITDDPAATGLCTFDGTLSDNGDGGTFSHAPLLTYEVTPGLDYLPGTTDALDPSGRHGMLPDFRSLFGDDNDDPGNGLVGTDGAWVFLPLSISLTGAGGVDDPAFIYKVTWTSSNPNGRRVDLDLTALGGGYQAPSGLLSTMAVASGRFTLTIIPGPAGAWIAALGAVAAGRRRRPTSSRFA